MVVPALALALADPPELTHGGYCTLLFPLFHLLTIAEIAMILGLKIPLRLADSDRRVQIVARLGLGALSLALAPVGLIPLGEDNDTYSSQPEWQQDLSSSIGILVIGGAAMYVAGIVRWEGRGPFWLRLVGWLGILVGLMIPSTLSLLLPIAGVLVATCGPIETEDSEADEWTADAAPR